MHLEGGTINAGAMYVENDAKLHAAGVINTLQLSNSAKLYVGGEGTIGTLQVNGDYKQTGTIEFAVQGNQTDVFNISGQAQLGGTLRVWGVGTFTLMSYGSKAGQFGQILTNGTITVTDTTVDLAP